MKPRTEVLIGLGGALVGVLVIVVSRVVDARWMLVAGVALVVLGVFAMLAPLLPERTVGTSLWQNDPGSSGGGGAG